MNHAVEEEKTTTTTAEPDHLSLLMNHAVEEEKTTTTTPEPDHLSLLMNHAVEEKKKTTTTPEPDHLSLLMNHAIQEEKTTTPEPDHLSLLMNHAIEEEKTTTPEPDHLSLLMNHAIPEEKEDKEDLLTGLLGKHHFRGEKTTTPAPNHVEIFNNLLDNQFCKKDLSCCMHDADPRELFTGCLPENKIKDHPMDDWETCKRHCASDDRCFTVERIDIRCYYHTTQCTDAEFGLESVKSVKTCQDGTSEYVPPPCTKKCLNGGTLHKDTCTCDCEYKKIFTGDSCEATCPKEADSFHCAGRDPIMCHMMGAEFMQDCPITCGLCPELN